KVIVDDALYPNEPFFNDGILAQAVDNVATSNDVVYLTAAGNSGNAGWASAFRGMKTTVGGLSGTYANVGSLAHPQALQHFTLAPGKTINLSFQWSSAFLEGGTNDPAFQVRNQLD